MFLFVGGFIPLSYIRVFKPLIVRDTTLPAGFGDESERRAALWGEILLAVGTVVAFIATLGSLTEAEILRNVSTPEKQCLAAIRDFETLRLMGNPSPGEAANIKSGQRNTVIDRCKNMH